MKTEIQDFLKSLGTIIDVRSPSEYSKGHIPGAYNLPLFSDEERAEIGTVYKQQGENQAIQLGLQFVGPKLHLFTDRIRTLPTPLKVHCWRGGKRSGAVAWLMQFAGYPTLTLSGGYKNYRKFVLEALEAPYNLHLIGGMTGTGKTQLLAELANNGEQTLDLEKLANHRGSAFGMIGQGVQPSQEQFENNIAHILTSFDPQRIIWIEDESRLIGCCHIPETLNDQMRTGPIIILKKTLIERVEVLLKEYGNYPSTDLILSVMRLQKKLGGVRTKQIVDFIQAGKLEDAIELILEYYDKAYEYSLEKRNSIYNT